MCWLFKLFKEIDCCKIRYISAMKDSTPHTEKRNSIRRLPHRMNRWLAFNMSDHTYVTMLALFVGLLTGVLAYVFRRAIGVVASWFMAHIEPDGINWWILVIPGVGIFLTGIFTRYVVHTDVAHGTAQLIRDVARRMFRLKKNVMLSPVIGGALTLGMGGSSGSEGPIAFAGAAIGSNLGQMFGLDDRRLKILLACGAASGISAIYMAPIGGLLYSLEVLSVGVSVRSVVTMTASCVVAFLVPYILNGFAPYIDFQGGLPADLSLVPWAALIGLSGGFYSLYYSKICNKMDAFFRNISNPWKRNLVGALILGAVIFAFPAMFSEGYGVVQGLINGDTSGLAKGSVLLHAGLGPWSVIVVALGILLFKCLLVSSTNSSGGVGGDFAPTLFSGSIVGFAAGFLLNECFGLDLPLSMCALFAMSSVMAGAIQAPLMSIFIVMEFCHAHEYALPISVCAFVSYLTVRSASWLMHYEPISHHINYFGKGHRHSTQ